MMALAGCEEEVGEVHCFWSWVGLVGCVVLVLELVSERGLVLCGRLTANSERFEGQRNVFGKGLYEVWGCLDLICVVGLLAFLGLGFLDGACVCAAADRAT
jgi:hypothetical protein